MTGQFTEQWYPTQKIKALLAQVRRAPRQGCIVEVGCWEGRSTVAIANEIYPRELIAIDHFNGDDAHTGKEGLTIADVARVRDVRAIFEQNMRVLTRGNVTLHPTDWRGVVPFLGPVGLVHIDGGHSYEEAHANVAAFIPLMVRRGIIVGDDWGQPGVRRAATELLGDVEHSWATWWWTKR